MTRKARNGYLHFGTITLYAFFLFVFAWLTGARAADLHVLAAASLTDALEKIAPAYEKATGDRLLFNFAGSNLLARQIQEGAPADIFISADDTKMNALEKAGLIDAKSRIELLSNTLVIVVPAQSTVSLASPRDLKNGDIKRIALAQPDSVPAGIYAKDYLTGLGIWSQIRGKVVSLDNVRATLAAVAAGNADAGIVYKTDAGISREVRVAYSIPQTEGPKISYPAAVIRDSKNAEKARQFLLYLRSAEAEKIFREFGFLTGN